MMKKLHMTDVSLYVAENISNFHRRRIKSLDKLKLLNILKRKNPYLYKAKYVLTAEQIVKGVIDAHISSNEETIFGNWLEGLAIFVNDKVYSGRKSGIIGIDLGFENNDKKYIVAIKSGPNWGNSSQVAKIKSDFITAKKTLRTGNSKLSVVAVNGCCYGKDNRPDKGSYWKYCGQQFWGFISGDRYLFTKIIEPIGYQAKEKNDEFLVLYARIINQFTKEFTNIFCADNGAIGWDQLVRLNSAEVSELD